MKIDKIVSKISFDLCKVVGGDWQRGREREREKDDDGDDWCTSDGLSVTSGTHDLQTDQLSHTAAAAAGAPLTRSISSIDNSQAHQSTGRTAEHLVWLLILFCTWVCEQYSVCSY